MSPEQSRGEEVDSRSDIFSFGVVLYEILTGVQPFLKDSAVETAHAILNEAPAPVSNYLDRTPVVLPHTVRKMLAKDPDRRYQHVGDVRIDLEELIGDSSQPSTESQAPMATSQWRQVLPWLLVGILVITVAMLVLIQSDEAPEGRGTVRFQIPPPEPELRVSAPMVSPDGKKIAFIGLDESGKRSLWVHKIDSSVAQKLAEMEVSGPHFWSPDSRFIGFFEHRELKKIDLEGGAAVSILADAGRGFGGTWNQQGTILFAAGSRTPIYRVSATGGEATPITQLDQSRREFTHRNPRFLPDGRHFLYVVAAKLEKHTGTYVGSLDSNERKLLGRFFGAEYTPPGYLINR